MQIKHFFVYQETILFVGYYHGHLYSHVTKAVQSLVNCWKKFIYILLVLSVKTLLKEKMLEKHFVILLMRCIDLYVVETISL